MSPVIWILVGIVAVIAVGVLSLVIWVEVQRRKMEMAARRMQGRSGLIGRFEGLRFVPAENLDSKPWERNPRAVPLDSDAYPADWSQPIFDDRVDTQSKRHIELKKRTIDFLRCRYLPYDQEPRREEPYIETEYMWQGVSGGRYFDVVLIEWGNPTVGW